MTTRLGGHCSHEWEMREQGRQALEAVTEGLCQGQWEQGQDKASSATGKTAATAKRGQSRESCKRLAQDPHDRGLEQVTMSHGGR